LQGKKKMAKKHNRIVFGQIRLLGFIFLWVFSFGVDCGKTAQLAEVDVSKEHFTVSCALERPVVHSGESITVNVWVTDSTGKALAHPPHYAWEVSIGKITGMDTAIWTFDKGDFGAKRFLPATAKVTVRDPLLGQGACELRVFFQRTKIVYFGLRPIRSQRLSGRAFLLSNGSEPAGYGLYSYLMFDTPPKDDFERARYLKALESYLLMLQPIEELEHYKRRSELNLMMIPVKRNIDLSTELSRPERLAKVAEQVLAAYDYARASALLAYMDKPALQGGPFLVAMKPAATDSGTLYLFMDMSRATPKLVWDWVRAFCALAAQTPTWGEVEVTKLSLNTRNAIAVAARDTPEVLGALQQWIRVFKPGKKADEARGKNSVTTRTPRR
jgi:hypothetical protein